MTSVAANVGQYSCKIAGKSFEVTRLSVDEQISRPYRIQVALNADDSALDPTTYVRKSATVKVEWGSSTKEWQGIVRSFSQTGAGNLGHPDEYGEYEAEIVPTFWLLTQKTNCRIFQEMSADQIIKKVLSERGVAGHFESKLGGYPVREYCVQYRETDFDFLTRLMEEEGIFYYFTHEGTDMLVLCDATGHYGQCAPESSVPWASPTGVLAKEKEYLSELSYSALAYSGKVKLKDYDFLEPKKPLKVEQNAPTAGVEVEDLEVYDYHPGEYDNDGRGRKLAKIEGEGYAARRTALGASGNWRSASAGCKFTLKESYRPDLCREWVIVSASHQAAAGENVGTEHSVSFEAVPSDVLVRPLRSIPRLSMNSQTAKVVGPKGDEVYMDGGKYKGCSAAKVQFHWDLEGKEDENSSCWIRVATGYAGYDEKTGNKHGIQFHPLIGDEVLVDFLEGDPDKPLIVGSVYNGTNQSPITPDELIRNIILTRYQHRLLFDDKEKAITLNTPYSHTLKMDDPLKQTKLTTDYGHQLEMWDPHLQNLMVPTVTLATGGEETLRMADKEPALGNNVKLATADGHTLLMAEGEVARGISIGTNGGNSAILSDLDRNIGFQTTDGHCVVLDDKNRTICVTSKEKHRIEVSDEKQFIEVADSSGKHHVTIDVAGGKITVETTSGDIDLLCPSGKLGIEASSIEMTAKGDIKVECSSMKTECKGKYKLQATTIQTKAHGKHDSSAATMKLSATAKLNLEAMTINVKANVMAKTTGAFVKSEAQAINQIRGVLVKIN